MAMLLLRLQLASNVCGGRASSWSSSFLPSSSSFLLSSSSIGTRGQAIGPWAATVRIRSSSWRRRPSHLSEDGNSSWTSTPPPPPAPSPPSPPPPPPPLSRPSSSPPVCTREQEQQRSRSSKYYYYLLLSDGVRKSRALRGSREVAKMDSMKDVTIPINMPPTATSLLVREEQKLKTSRMTRQGAVVALSYMVCAVLLVMFNKAALSTYNFPCANVITVLQMVCSTALLYVLRKLDIITFANDGNGTMDPVVKGFVPLRMLKRASPLSIAYLFYMVLGMASIRGVNVPMYTTLRRTTVLFTMVLEFFLVGQKHSTPVVFSVGFIVLGALIAGARDLSFDAYGYLVVLASNLTTATYLTTISRLGKSTGLNSFGLMWCNGIICGPILLLWTMLSGELGMALRFPAMLLPGFQLVLVLSCMMAFCLNYTIFLNTSLNSPLTQTMCGNLKDLGTVLIGWLLFGGLPFDWLNVLGQLLGFLGSGLYAYCKLRGI